MATSKSYFSRSNYRFLSTDAQGPTRPDSMAELNESDIWNTAAESPELRKQLKKYSSPARRERNSGGVGAPASLPVNVPDWSKILKEEYNGNRRNNSDDDEDFSDDEGYGNRVPPHEFVARQLARTRISSFSVHEGIGRTLKGRDLSRVRNAIWEKTGYQD